MPRFISNYPQAAGDHITLRAEPDWDQPIQPHDQSAERQVFDLPVESGVRQVKLVLERDGDSHWSIGANYIVTARNPEHSVYPCFFQDAGRLTGTLQIAAPALNDVLRIRIFLPPGYDENTLKRYPVLYASDGANLFEPEESAFGQDWAADETVSLLNRMSVIDKVIVVGVQARDGHRNEDYTQPGYEALGRALVQDLVPKVDGVLRTLARARDRAVIGSSLGGVLALYLWWTHRDTFGSAAALSATFGLEDDLYERVVAEEIPASGRVYLDSGYPKDNFEAVRRMAAVLEMRGIRHMYLAHPRGIHNELAWADRLHLPLEYLFG